MPFQDRFLAFIKKPFVQAFALFFSCRFYFGFVGGSINYANHCWFIYFRIPSS